MLVIWSASAWALAAMLSDPKEQDQGGGQELCK